MYMFYYAHVSSTFVVKSFMVYDWSNSELTDLCLQCDRSLFALILFNFLFCLLIEEWADIPNIFMLFLNGHKMFNYFTAFYVYLLASGKTDMLSGDQLLENVQIQCGGDMDGHEKRNTQWNSYEIGSKEIKINISLTILFYFGYL